MGEKIFVSYIVISRNRANERLENCLEALRIQTMTSEHVEIILLDYGSDKEWQNQLEHLSASFGARHVYVDEKGPWNRGRAINLGSQTARGELLAISDIDMIHSPDYAAKAWQSYLESGRGLFYGRAIPYNLPKELQFCRNELRTKFNELLQQATPRPRGMGNVVFSRTLFEKIRGWEEEYAVWGCEDSDFHDRANRSGAYCAELSAGLLHQWHEMHDCSPEARNIIGTNRVMFLGSAGRSPVTRTGSFGRIPPLPAHKTFQAPSLALVVTGTRSITHVAPTLISINNGTYPIQEILLPGFTGDINALRGLCDFPLRALPYEDIERILTHLKSEICTDVLGFLPAGISFDEYFLTYERLGNLLSGKPNVEGFFWWGAKGYDASHQILTAPKPRTEEITQTIQTDNKDTDNSLKNRLLAIGWENKLPLYDPIFDCVQDLNPVTDPKASVIVITWRFHPDSEKALARLANQDAPSHQVILVDNGCSEGELNRLRPYVHTLVKLRENTGAYLARNVGALFAQSPILIFLDDDGIPGERFVEEHLKAHTTYGIVAARGAVLPKTDNPLNALVRHYHLGPTPFPVFADIEGNTSYHAQSFLAVGGWDDSIRFGGGGIELAMRLLKAFPDWGNQIYWPTATIRHDYSPNKKTLEAKQTKQEASRRVMEAKHSSYHKVIDAWNCTHGKIETIAPLSKTPKPEPDWQERSLEQSMVDADLILSRRFQAAGNPHAALVLSQRARLWLANEKPSTNIVPSPINGANVMQQARALEAQISTLTKATRTELLFKAVVDFLSHRGESERMASWVKDLQMSEGEIAAPHDGPPVVSVVIPCHNYGNYLTECVESVLRQRFRAWELIIINDGSTDNTHEVAKEILQKYPAHAIRYIKQKCHGIVQPRNRGVTLAKGEFILPLDADDLIAPEFLNKTVSEMTQNPELGYVSTKALFFGSVNSIWPSEPFNCVNLLVTNQQTNSTLYRKRMWKEIGGYNEQMVHGYVDWEFWIRATKLGWSGKQLDEPLFFYRRKTKSVVTQAKTKDVKIKEQIIRLHPDVYDSSKIKLCKNEICRENWIPPVLIRDDFSIPKKLLNEGNAIEHGYNAKKIVLGLLEQLLPSAKHIFTMPESGKGDPSIYQKLYSKLLNKSSELIENGLYEKAVETSASLLALFPTTPSAGILMAKTLLRTSRIEEAYNFAKHYQSLFPMENNFRDITTNLLHSIAKSTLNKQQSMALLDAACILSPKDKKLWAELASYAYERDQIRTAQRALSIARDKPVQPHPETACIWYITDTFGFGAGGINGVTQAKFMTLSSIIRGNTGPNIVVITKWHTDLPEALAEFSIFCENIYGKGGFRWPLWIALENDQNINQHPRWKYTENPCLIIEEGVLLEGHRFLNTLHEIPTCQRAFIHHTSPQQYTGEFEYKNLFNEAQEALVQYDHHICVSSNVIKEWIQIDELDSKNWVYIPNCAHEEEADRLLKINKVSLRKELGLSQNALIYLCLASVQTRKGHDILLDQMEKVLNSIDNAQLICIGPIHEEWSGKDIVQNARNRFNLDQVRFLGVRRNALEYVRACDCLVLPSREEALPLVILEAMALSKPCIASNVNGIPELIEHGETGLLFSLQAQNDLALHMITLAKHPELMKSMGKKAKQRYNDKFRRQIHAHRWKSFIDSILNHSTCSDSSIYNGSLIHKSMANKCHSLTHISGS